MNKLLFMKLQISSWSLKKSLLFELNSDWFRIKSCCLGSSMMMKPCVCHAIDFGKLFCACSRMYRLHHFCLLHILENSDAACLQH
jgi:hypothetical protein